MRLLALVAGLIFPGCGGIGADAIPVQPLIDFTRLERPGTPNTALAAPAGFAPPADIVTPRYSVAPAQLFDAVQAVAEAQPRTYPQIHYADHLQAHYVARSALWNFPDLIAVQVNADSTLILWSRSIYGHSDLGVNRNRVAMWLKALDERLAGSKDQR